MGARSVSSSRATYSEIVEQAALASILKQFVRAAQVEFPHEIRAVTVDRAQADEQPRGDLLVVVPLGQQP